MKYLGVKEFREKGYLQELNRRFLHPLGLAFEVIIEEDGKEKLGGIWDYREDEEGIYYDLQNSSMERIEEFKRKENFISNEINNRVEGRMKKLGFYIEPILTKAGNKNKDR